MSVRDWRRSAASSSGQSMVEFAMVLPLVLMLVLGVVEIGYALLDDHVVTKLAREGANLISRDTTLQDAATAMQGMTTPPVNFSTGATMVFSVIKKGTTSGTSNYNKDVLYQRYSYGALAATSRLTTAGSASFGPAPDFIAANSDSDTRLQVTNLPANLIPAAPAGGIVYVTEIFSTHVLITPLDRLGISLPQTLYSIAYF
jgi:Flp pilus assembly protein TadG